MRLIEELREMAGRRHKLVAELQELDATFAELKALVNGDGVVAIDSVRGRREGRAGGGEVAARRDRILAVLGNRVMRAAEIARESGIQSTAVHSDLIALATNGRVEKTSDGYRVVGAAPEGARDAASSVPFSTPEPVGAMN